MLTTRNIYDFIRDKIIAIKSQNISDDIIGASGDDSEAKARKEQLIQAQKILQDFESTIIKTIDDYNNVAEFDTFTIAFYGETNAGKSTVIEALRIYFGESSKQNERAKFDENYKRYKYYNEALFGKILAFFIPALKSSAIKWLLKFSDGAIIGDGRTDFTRKSSIYHFDYNGIKFDILDVPGIEGKESAVIDEILKATKKAHCVFYITRNPQPPQKGDSGESKGTLEKIKEHLGAQTEIYSVFNKGIKNPNAISDSIIQVSDENGLNDLDNKMRDELGKHYMGRKTISAQVAFYALGEKIFEENRVRNRDKFINVYPKDELLKKSLFLDFAKFISNDLVQNASAKIKKSNFNKAQDVLQKFSQMLKSLCNIYNDLYTKCNKEVMDSCDNLIRIIENANVAFNSVSDKIINDFKSSVRKDMYDYIAKNVKDSAFEARFKQVIESRQENLANEFQQAFESKEKEIQSDIERELANFQRRIGNVAKEFQTISIKNSLDSSLNIDIDSGLDKMGLLGVGIGVASLVAVTNFWNLAGWVAIVSIVCSVGAIVISFVKSIRKLWDSDYKMAQQRNAVDENLSNICSDMRQKCKEAIRENIENNLIPYGKNLTMALQNSIESINNINAYFKALQENEVLPLINQIKQEGGL